MALDFYNNLDRKQHLFAVESKQLAVLSQIFDEFQRWTGIDIDEYGDFVIDTKNQKVLLKLIDSCIQKMDLNKDKDKTVLIMEFRSMIKYFLGQNIDLHGLGD